jgi:predicted RNA binding protein YcfA (HicA-like mRNA interferase family)
VTYAELTRKLRTLGCVFKRQARGSHEIWHNPHSNRSGVIPNHPGDLPKGTLRAILKGLDITREDFDSV